MGWLGKMRRMRQGGQEISTRGGDEEEDMLGWLKMRRNMVRGG